MNTVLNKLKSRRGASIIYALIFLMLCAVVGSVMLSAATVAAGRGREEKASQSAYYAVSSAAKLLREELAGTEVAIREDQLDSGAPTVTNAPGTGAFSGALMGLVRTRYDAGNGAYQDQTVEVYLAPKGESWVDPVRGTLTLDSGYNVTVALWREGDMAYPMTFTLTADVGETSTTLEYQEEDTPHVLVHTLTTVSWDPGEIRKGVAP